MSGKVDDSILSAKNAHGCFSSRLETLSHHRAAARRGRHYGPGFLRRMGKAHGSVIERRGFKVTQGRCVYIAKT